MTDYDCVKDLIAIVEKARKSQSQSTKDRGTKIPSLQVLIAPDKLGFGYEESLREFAESLGVKIQRVVSDPVRIPLIEEENGKNVVKYVTEKLGPNVVSVSELASGEKSGVFFDYFAR